MKALTPVSVGLATWLNSLREPTVRDLAWLLFSAGLLCESPPMRLLACPCDMPQDAYATRAWLLELDRDVSDFQQFMVASRVTRLGHYAECLLTYFLRYGPAERLIAANVVLRNAQRTIGECDFLVQALGESGQRLHWELAVKCYLHIGDGREHTSFADYVGPNLQDRFDWKLTHLLTNQLRLCTREEFASLGYGAGPWQAQMFIKGWLFYRWEEARNVFISAAASVRSASLGGLEINPAHERGFWVTRAEWMRFAAASHRQTQAWVRLRRLEWLAPRPPMMVDSLEANTLVDARAIQAQTESSCAPILVAALVRDDTNTYWVEHSRGFIVPDDWPERALAFTGE